MRRPKLWLRALAPHYHSVNQLTLLDTQVSRRAQAGQSEALTPSTSAFWQNGVFCVCFLGIIRMTLEMGVRFFKSFYPESYWVAESTLTPQTINQYAQESSVTTSLKNAKCWQQVWRQQEHKIHLSLKFTLSTLMAFSKRIKGLLVEGGGHWRPGCLKMSYFCAAHWHVQRYWLLIDSKSLQSD